MMRARISHINEYQKAKQKNMYWKHAKILDEKILKKKKEEEVETFSQ